MAAKRVRDRNWLESEETRLESLRMQGLQAQEIAGILGRSLHSVKAKLVRIGIAYPLGASAWLDVLNSGITDSEAAKQMGVKINTVRTRRSRLRHLGYEFADGRTMRWRREYE
jgi:DNA-binding CsgD family transcriptional regulator